MIDAYAHALATAQQQLADDTATRDRCAQALATAQQRIATKRTALAEIQQRRLAGTESETDEPRIAALQLDIDGLAPLLATAERNLVDAEKRATIAQAAVSQADAAWVQACAHSDAIAVEQRIREIDATMCRAIRRLYALKCAAQGRPAMSATGVYRLSEQLDRFARLGVIPG